MTGPTIGVVQAAFPLGIRAGLEKSEALIRVAAARGARLILMPGRFGAPCLVPPGTGGVVAGGLDDGSARNRVLGLAAELDVVLPILDGAFGVSGVIDGARGHHLVPDLQPSVVLPTRFGPVRLDDGFAPPSEASGAGSEDLFLLLMANGAAVRGGEASEDAARFWKARLAGFAAAAATAVAWANRVGAEPGPDGESVLFHGGSIVGSADGRVIAEADHAEETILVATLPRRHTA